MREQDDRSSYPFRFTLSELLAWGVPVVRKHGVDYFLADPLEQSIVSMRESSTTPPGAVLTESSLPMRIEVTLRSVDGEEVFAGDWKLSRTFDYCPEWDPRTLARSAIRTADGKTLPATSRVLFNDASAAKPLVISVTKLADTTQDKLVENNGCASGVRMFSSRDLPAFHEVPEPLRLAIQGQNVLRAGDTYFQWPDSSEASLTCVGDAGYVVSGFVGATSDGLHVDKLLLPSAKRGWKQQVLAVFEHPTNVSPHQSDVRVQSFSEIGDQLVAVVAYVTRDGKDVSLLRIELQMPEGNSAR